MKADEAEKIIQDVAADFAVEGIYLTDEDKNVGRRILNGGVNVEDVVKEICRKYEVGK